LFEELHRGVNIKPQLLVGLAADDLMEVQELGVVFLLGIKYIVAISPFTMNDNALVIGDKLIAGINTIFGITPTGLLEEGEFLVCHVWGGGAVYIIEHLSLNW